MVAAIPALLRGELLWKPDVLRAIFCGGSVVVQISPELATFYFRLQLSNFALSY
jgi:hypothetical protein